MRFFTKQRLASSSFTIKSPHKGNGDSSLTTFQARKPQNCSTLLSMSNTEQRKSYRSDHYTQNLHTISGHVTLKVPKFKGVSFETAIIECYHHHEINVKVYTGTINILESIAEILKKTCKCQ